MQRPIALFLCFIGCALLLAAATRSAAAVPEAPRVTLDTVRVDARRMHFGATTVIPSREGLERALAELGVLGVRRGVGLAADVNADGFRRTDVPVIVDGERYHCACPNRMDPPTSLALPIEIAQVTWERGSSAVTSGLAGEIAMGRRGCAQDLVVRAGAEGNLSRSSDGTASVAVEGRGQRLSGRWTGGHSFRDGHGASFGSRYGYREADIGYTQGDLSYRGQAGAWSWGAQGSATRDVPYAYLQMDERVNEMWNASIARGPHKLYVNRTRHLMDNGLRTSPSAMRTAADQFTAGALARVMGVEVEAYAREWNANNTIAMGSARVANRMLPRFRQWSAIAARTLAAGGVQWSGKLGVSRAAIGERSALGFYRTLEPGARSERWFVPFAFGASRVWPVSSSAHAGAMAEVASDVPAAEQLYIQVHRPGMPATKKPDWSGNPTLAAPVRASLRGQLRTVVADVELGGSWVGDYALPVARRAGNAAYTTYAGVRAAIASARAGGRLGFAQWTTAYALGWNLTGRVPLAEIAPWTGSLVVRPPLARGVEGLLRVETAAAQYRVDRTLGESGTRAWGRLDVGLRWLPAPGAEASLVVENVTGATYADHLAYLRDPFAAGVRVTEPGRTLRLGFTLEH